MNVGGCTEAVPPRFVKVGAWEFPFATHDESRLSMSAVGSSIERKFGRSAFPSEGLLHLGSGTSERISIEERTP